MKRPVFWAVVVFALGEVVGLARHGLFILCIIGFCVAARYRVVRYWLLLFLVLGYGRMWIAVKEQHTQDVLCERIADMETKETFGALVYDIDNNNYAYVLLLEGKQEYLGIRVVLYGDNQPTTIGDYIRVEGKLVNFSRGTNPGEFNGMAYYRLQGLSCGLMIENMETLASSVAYPIKTYLYRWKKKFSSRIKVCAEEETACLYQGLLLGDKTEISDETIRLFKLSGISHILSISALHVSLIGLTLWRLIRRLGGNFVVAAMLAGILVFSYGCMTGFHMSTIRAIVMLIIVFVGEIIGRQADILTSLSIVCGTMLWMKPMRLLDGGFLLGVLAVFGIFIAQEILKLFTKNPRLDLWRRRHRYQYLLFTSLVTSISIQIITIPILSRLYFAIPTYAPVMNLVVIPLMTPIMILGLLGLGMSLVAPVISQLLFLVGGKLLDFIIFLCRLNVRLPGYRICTGSLRMIEIGIYYGGLLLLGFMVKYGLQHKRPIKARLASLYLIFFTIGLFVLHRNIVGEMVVFLDVGQGDGTIIRGTSGNVYVVDGGSSSKEKLGQYVIEPALGFYGMQKVDVWFVSHFDEDHMSGLMEILESYPYAEISIDCIAYSGLYQDNHPVLALARQHGIEVRPMWQGDIIETNGETIRFLFPRKDIPMESDNDASLCFSYESKEKEILFTGDLGNEWFEYAVDVYSSKISEDKISILKVPHHGSRNSLSERSYDYFDEAVISCGKNNHFGHPHREVLDSMIISETIIRRTDEEGCIKY